MIVVPAAMPCTVPVVMPIVAMPVLPLLQVPPGVGSPSVVVAPEQTLALPVIDSGSGLTVKVVVVPHPVGSAYVIVAVLADKPETVPVLLSMVATLVALLAHVPPTVRSLSVVAEPAHTSVVPEIKPGTGFTVTIAVALHPEAKE